jgi:hypothetical protein
MKTSSPPEAIYAFLLGVLIISLMIRANIPFGCADVRCSDFGDFAVGASSRWAWELVVDIVWFCFALRGEF